MVAMGNIGHKLVVMADGMMVAMGMLGHGVVVWKMGWWWPSGQLAVRWRQPEMVMGKAMAPQ